MAKIMKKIPRGSKKRKPLNITPPSKSFVKEKIGAKKSGKSKFQFVMNEAWMSNAEQFVTIRGNGTINSDKNAIFEPGKEPWVLVHLVVGRSRTHRYIVTDGKKYHDVSGTRKNLYSRSTDLRHGACSGPWVIVDMPFRALNQNAHAVIKKSIETFYKDKID
jgi:hypothetical protein